MKLILGPVESCLLVCLLSAVLGVLAGWPWLPVGGALGCLIVVLLRNDLARKTPEPPESRQSVLVNPAPVVEEIERLREKLAMLHLLESAVVHARDAVLVLEAEPMPGRGRSVLYANSAFAEMTGYSVAEVHGRSLYLLRGPQSDPATLESLRRALECGHAFKGELQNYRKDGSTYWAEISLVPVPDASGQTMHWVMIQRDISERKRQEEELRRTDQLLRAIIDAFPGNLNAKDRDGRYMLMNRTQAAYYGTTPEAAVGRQIEELAGPDLARRIRERDQQVLDSGVALQFEETLRDPDGQVRDWLATKVPLCREGAGPAATRVMGIVTVYTDVTELKRIQLALAQRENMLAEAQRIAHIASWEYDPIDSRIDWTDEKFRILGYEPGSFPPSIERFLQAVHPDDHGQVSRILHEALSGAHAGAFEYRIVRPGGEIRHLRDEFQPVPRAGGKPPLFSGITQDITERRQAEQQFFQAQKMELVGQMAGGIAHDFNNLLTAIIGNLNLTPTEPGSKQARQIDTALRAANRAAELTRKLLGFARKNQLSVTPVSVRELVSEAYEFVSRTFDPKIAVTTEILCDSCVCVDLTLMSQVLLNLSVNARDAMPDGGELRIRAEEVDVDQPPEPVGARSGRFVRISVEDNGEGMTPEVRHRIFEPFFTTKPVGKGTGLGLPMVQGTMLQHKGWVTCHSTLGVGTRFDLFLPLLPAGLPAMASSLTPVARVSTERVRQYAETPPRPPRVLLVDDEEMIRTVGRCVLESSGMEVLEASDGDEAISLYQARADQIDLVVLDLTMPRISGREACRAIRELHPQARVLFSSGFSNEKIMASDGALGLLAKPYRPQELLEAVHRALDAECCSRSDPAAAPTESAESADHSVAG